MTYSDQLTVPTQVGSFGMKFGTFCKVVCRQQQVPDYQCLYKPPRITKPRTKVVFLPQLLYVALCVGTFWLDQSVRSSGMVVLKPDVSMPIWFPLNCVSLSFVQQHVIQTWSKYISGDLAHLWWSVANLLPCRLEITRRSVHVGFMVDNMTMGQVFLWVYQFIPLSIIPPMLHNHSHINYAGVFSVVKLHVGSFLLLNKRMKFAINSFKFFN